VLHTAVNRSKARYKESPVKLTMADEGAERRKM
jgi:hypothetical protein